MPQTIRRSNFSFFFPLRVRFSEVDAQNVVYNAHYLTYFDVGLHEFFRALNCDYIAIMSAAGVDSRVVHVGVDYLGSIAFDDRIEVAVRVDRLGHSSITYAVALFADGSHEAKAGGTVIWVIADPRSGRSAEIPERLRAILEPEPHPLSNTVGELAL